MGPCAQAKGHQPLKEQWAAEGETDIDQIGSFLN